MKKEEPPNYLISIVDKVRKHKIMRELKAKREDDENMHVLQTAEDTYKGLVDYCKQHGIQLSSNSTLSAEPDAHTRRMLVESLCLNVDNSFVNYKGSGNVDKTLRKVNLVKSKLLNFDCTITEMLEKEAKELEAFRAKRKQILGQIKSLKRKAPTPKYLKQFKKIAEDKLAPVVILKDAELFDTQRVKSSLDWGESVIFNKCRFRRTSCQDEGDGLRKSVKHHLRSISSQGSVMNLLNRVSTSLDFSGE